jgi:uncharacterized membrane-anchored protein
MIEPKPASLRTKLLSMVYLASGTAGLLMVIWLALIFVISFVSEPKLPAGFLFPWLPVAALVMFAAKIALRWSLSRDGQAG